MSKAEPNVYLNNIFVEGKTDDDGVYEECFDTDDQSDYEEVSGVAKPNSPDINISHNMPKIQSIKGDNSRSKTMHAQLRLLCFISCSVIALVVSNVVTFITTKDKFSEKKTNLTPCIGLNCLNGGSCEVLNGTFHCSCDSGFSGRLCEVTPCTRLNCLNGGSGEVLNGTFHCSCVSGFSGRLCDKGNGDKLGVRFSRTDLYYSYYISDDNTTLSNVNTDETSTSASARLLTYRGTISDTCVGDDELIYYEVNYTYSIKTELTKYFDKEDILEVGIAERSNVDKYKYAGVAASGWSFDMYYTKWLFDHNGSQTVYINARHNGHNQQIQRLSTTYAGEELHGQLKIFINTRRNEFTVLHNDLKIYVFDEVKSNETLCPVFGVYNPNYVNVQLKILNSLNFSMYPW